MKRVGIVSYNMYGNFTNYGSALQTFALQSAIAKIFPNEIEPLVVDYCPDILMDKDILNPMSKMWDQDPLAIERCRQSLPAIRINYEKFKCFYSKYYNLTSKKYTSGNFNFGFHDEALDGYVCGSDTVFAVPEFGFDDGFYASYPVMQGKSIAYAASFGDWDIDESSIPELRKRLSNFKSIALREEDKVQLVKKLVQAPVYKVLDPTLLLSAEDYSDIIIEPNEIEPYLLLYSRRGNNEMQEFAEQMAKEKGLKIIEISLNAQNAAKHTMRYDAGVEEFLGLIKNASVVVTNSFHGMIFSIQFRTPFYIFSRKLCDTKIKELLRLFSLENRMRFSQENNLTDESIESIDFDRVHFNIESARKESINILRKELHNLVL